METFSYKALKNEKYVKGELEGKDVDEVAGKLREKGMEVLSVQPLEEKKSDSKKKSVNIPLLGGSGKVKKSEKVFLYKNISTMLHAGLPLPEVIDLLRESIKNQKMIDVLSELKYDVESGNYISASLASHPDVFGTNEIAMIKAGEAGGTLPESFNGLYEDAEAENNLQKDIKGAMMYPAIILSILALVTIVLLVFVLPQLTGFFKQANIEVPKVTQIIMAASDFMKAYFLYIGAGLAALFVGVRILLKKSKKFKKTFDKILIKIPFIGKQIKLFYIYKIARMLGLLIKSGVPILQALEIVQKSVQHIGYARSIKDFRDEVKHGGNLSDAVAKYESLYPAFVSRMLKVGDKTGNTADALDNISSYYREELQNTLDNLPSLIEPVLMLCLGAGVAVIAISVLLPLYSIVSGVSSMGQS